MTTPASAKKRTFAKIVTPPPGPKSREIVEREKPFMAPGTQAFSQLAGIAVEKGKGAVLEDVDGNQYLDLVAGICVASLGHGHPAMAKVLGEQAEKVMIGSFTPAPRARLLESLVGLAPAGLEASRAQLYSGGAEAVESALRLARSHTKKYEVVSFWGGFHGKTGGVLPLLGSDFKHGLGPFQTGMHIVPYADCYRCPFKLAHPSCGNLCVDFAREAIKRQTAGSVAAIIAEPIQGTNGNVIPPDDFLPAIRDIARELDAVFIADEMITGFGRSGKMWGVQHSGTKPDMITIGKAFGAGYPITGLVAKNEICGAKPWANPSFSSSSYGGNPLAAAAAEVAIGTVVKEDLVGNSHRVGEIMLAALRPLQDRFPFVGDVRGRGLMIGLELVKDKDTKAPLAKKACEWVYLEGLKRGLLAMTYTNRVRINPPLVITEAQALEAVDILTEVLTALEGKPDLWKS